LVRLPGDDRDQFSGCVLSLTHRNLQSLWWGDGASRRASPCYWPEFRSFLRACPRSDGSRIIGLVSGEIYPVMSGILGFAGNTLQAVHVGQLRRALRSLEQWGRDDRSILLFNNSGPSSAFLDATSERSHSSPVTSDAANDMATAMLACCHLPEEDRASKRGQYLESANCRVFLACDAVIDNGPELSQELQKLGHDLRSSSPREILLAALEQWGSDGLPRVRGSFAFAALNFHRRSLILARDAFGTRPLFYSHPDSTRLFFSSQIAALLELTSAAPRVNRASLYRHLAHNIMDHAPETFFAGISQVPPGHYLEASLDKPSEFSVTPYRRVVPVQTKLSFEEAAQRLRELVISSVTSQVGAQDSLGAAHSGGFDSSFVIAAFEHTHSEAQLQLYTCIPLVRNGTFAQSEETWADLAAAGFRSSINKVRVSSEGLPGEFASLVCLQEEPFSSPVVFAQLQLFRAAQDNGVRMMLSGQGGDTLFATSADQLLRAVLAHLRRGRWGNATSLLKAGAQLPQWSFQQLARAAMRTVLPGGLPAFARRLARTPHPDWLKVGWFELDSIKPLRDPSLPMLRFEDRNSVACSILNRMPLLTVELQDFVRSLPAEYLVRADQPIKSIECAALRGLVPDAILERKERSGFPVPVKEWLDELGPWVETNITEISCLPFLEPRRVRQVWESVRLQNTSVSAAFLVWRWIFLAGWLRHMNVRLD
jgi:asparagine synthase (glutamine-hydrolysing)